MKRLQGTPTTPLRGLINVLRFKIGATILCWCIPLLTFPASTLVQLGFPRQEEMMFLRMLGWAYLALCVGYAFALVDAHRGHRLVGTVWVGIVSNGGACALLLQYGVSGSWQAWGALAQIILWGSAISTGLITAGLLGYGLRRT